MENPRNPRRHPDEQIEGLAASLRRFGQPKEILVRKANLMVVAGHGILRAARRAGLTEIAVNLWDVDQATADAYMLADNRHGDLSADDPDRVAELLREIDRGDFDAVGYSEDEVAALLSDLATSDIDVREVETGDVEDRAWVSIRCPLARQADMLRRLRDVLEEFPDVEVDLGTVAVG